MVSYVALNDKSVRKVEKKKRSGRLITAKRNGVFAPFGTVYAYIYAETAEQEKLIFILIIRSYGYVLLGSLILSSQLANIYVAVTRRQHPITLEPRCDWATTRALV